jgi:hypothetical protein
MFALAELHHYLLGCAALAQNVKVSTYVTALPARWE